MIKTEKEQPNMQNRQKAKMKKIIGVINQEQNTLILKTRYRSSTNASNNIKKQVIAPYKDK